MNHGTTMRHTLLTCGSQLLASFLQAAQPPLVLILSGQPNMQGVGQAGQFPLKWRTPPGNVTLMNWGQPQSLASGRVGPEVTLAHALARAMPDRPIVLFKAARTPPPSARAAGRARPRRRKRNETAAPTKPNQDIGRQTLQPVTKRIAMTATTQNTESQPSARFRWIRPTNRTPISRSLAALFHWKGRTMRAHIHATRTILAGLACTICTLADCADPPIKTVKPDGTPNRAAWMAQASFGVMTHYLVSPKGNSLAEKTAGLNRIIDAFDIEAYVKQIDETQADWVIFTLCQGTGFLSSRCEFLDKLEAGYTPKRDLIPELGRRLHEHGKRLIIYLPGAHTEADPNVKRLLGRGGDGYADRHNAFVRDYSQKMGRSCDGWWFDSCGQQDNTAWEKEMAACRAGNSDSVVAFSGAEFCASGGNLKPICPVEDYHAGEIHLLEDGRIRTDFIWPPGEGIVISADAKLRRAGQPAQYYLPDSQFIGNVQWHCLLPIDLTFNPAVPNQYCHYTDKELFQFVDRVKSVGGAVTINVPIDTTNGHIPQDSHAQLVRLGQHLKNDHDRRK